MTEPPEYPEYPHLWGPPGNTDRPVNVGCGIVIAAVLIVLWRLIR